MDCPSCHSKAKENGPDHILCSTCGELHRTEQGEWVPGAPAPKDPPEHQRRRDAETPVVMEPQDEALFVPVRLTVGDDEREER